MKTYLKRKWEAWIIRRVANFLDNREVERSGVTSRSDNRKMDSMVDELNDIADRISDGYNHPYDSR